MAEPINPLYLKILDACRAQSPEPLYPRPFAIAENIDRRQLDEALDYLRLHGLLQFTDWVQDMGQGYTLTDEGVRILKNPMLLGRPLPRPEPAALESGAEHGEVSWQRGEAIRDCLIRPVRPVVTRVLLLANIAVFALGLYLASQENIGNAYFLGQNGVPGLGLLYIRMGSLFPPLVEMGDWWRLFSYAFLHGGILHIALNMYFLFNIGPLVESLWGSWRFAVLYVIGTLGGGLAGLMVSQMAVGASGALCGLLTSMGVWLFMSRRHLPPDLVRRWQSNLVTNVFLLVIISFMPGVSWSCHLGGAIGGLVIGVLLHLNRFGSGIVKGVALVGMVLLPVAGLGALYLPYNSERENERFRSVHLRPVQQLSSDVKDFYDQYGKVMKNNGPLAIGDAKPKAETILSRVIKESGELEERLKAGSFQSPEIKATVPPMLDYLEVSKGLAELYQKSLAEPEAWNLERRVEIQKQVNRYWQAQGTLMEKSPFLR